MHPLGSTTAAISVTFINLIRDSASSPRTSGHSKRCSPGSPLRAVSSTIFPVASLMSSVPGCYGVSFSQYQIAAPYSGLGAERLAGPGRLAGCGTRRRLDLEKVDRGGQHLGRQLLQRGDVHDEHPRLWVAITSLRSWGIDGQVVDGQVAGPCRNAATCRRRPASRTGRTRCPRTAARGCAGTPACRAGLAAPPAPGPQPAGSRRSISSSCRSARRSGTDTVAVVVAMAVDADPGGPLGEGRADFTRLIQARPARREWCR